MTATDELRRLLDERGVEYKETTSGNTTIFDFDYCEQCDDYLHTIAITGACISAYLDYLEPKQAIAATLGDDGKPCYATDYTHARCKYSVNRGWTEDTKFYVPTAKLGRGTCKNKAPEYLDFLCSECGFVHYLDDVNCTGDGNEWEYCPKCGLEVKR